MNKILVIGGGSIGKRHLKNLISLGERELAMCELDRARAETNKMEFGITVFEDLEKAFLDYQPSIVFVCSPSVFHLEQSIKAARLGCDLFVEKPLSNTMFGIEELCDIAKEKNLVTMMGSNWKFYPLFIKIKELLEGNMIGKILSVRCEFGQYLPDWHPWEDYRQGYSANKKLGGGILLDSHEFDYITWFMGDVRKLSCIAKKVSDLEIDVEDISATILEFKSGAVGEMHLDYLQRFYQRNYEFFGERGTIWWSGDLKRLKIKIWGQEEKEIKLDDNYDINLMYKEEIKHFLNCVNKRTTTITPVSRGAEVLKLIMAVKESAITDKTIYL